MSPSRNVAIPWHHTIAELVAFPLASEAALVQRLTSLDRKLAQEETWRVWRAAERELIATSPSLSIDELVDLRDNFWFSEPEHEKMNISLARYLRRAAKRFLLHSGTLAIPNFKFTSHESREGGQLHPAHARSMWRWMSFALPPDLLLAALGMDGELPERVHTLSPLVEQRLKDGGFAEPHLHLGAALDFPLLWVSALKALGELSPRRLLKIFKSPGAFLDEGAMFGVWLLRAAIARYLLGAFLDHARGARNLESFLRERVEPRILELGRGLSMVMKVRAAIEGLAEAAPGDHDGSLDIGRAISDLQSAYVELTSIRTRHLAGDLENAWKIDPLAAFLPDWVGRGTPEAWLINRGLEYLETEAGRKDRLFDLVFWQVVRVRCLFYRHIVQRPMTPGLQWFIRFFARMSPVRKPLKGMMLQSALKSSGLDAGLRSLEVRISPEGQGMLKLIGEAERLLKEHVSSNGQGQGTQSELELGFVVHFQRERGGESQNGRPAAFGRDCDANPSKNTTGYRHAQFYKKRREETLGLRNLLTEHALSLEWIRGLDLCSDEVGVPVWVMAPLLRHARDAGEVASRILRRSRLELEVPGCRIAVHAGEDFVHLLTGLRRLDEAIEGLRLRPGDRLGHALSLGLDVSGWARRAGNVVMPAEDRLLDLAWEWNWRSRNGGQLTRNRHLLIEREIAELSLHLFGGELSPLDVVRLIEDLYDEERLRQAGFPNGPVPMVKEGSSPQERRFHRMVQFLTSEEVYSRGRELRWVDPAQDVEALEELQRALRQKVGARELVVEVNPSSNLLIGHLADISQHPLWRLRPIGGGDGVPAVALIIGSDDPITFATELRQEYQIVYDTLVLSGCSSEQAEGWIEGVRRTSLTARFTVPWSRRGVRDLKSSDWSDEQRRGLVDPP